MKAFILCCLLSLCAMQLNAQEDLDNHFICHAQEEVEPMLDSLLAKGTRKYELRKIRQDNEHYTFYIYKGAKEGDTDSVNLMVRVNHFMKDANPALEIKGTPVYKVNDIYGTFLDLFAIYQLADPEADPEKAAQRGGSKTITSPAGERVIYSIKQTYNPDSPWHFRRF